MDGAAKVKVAEGAVSSSFPSSSPPKIAPSLLEGNDGVSDAESANAEDGAGYGGPGSGEWGPEFQFRSSLVRIRAPVTEIDDAEGDEEEEEEDDDDASGASYDTALERMAAASTLSSLYGSPRGTPTGSLFGSEAGERDSLRRRLREVMPASESGWPDPGEEYGNGNGGEGQLIPVAKLTADDELLEYGEQSGLVSGASGYLYSDEEEEYGEEVTSGLRPSAAGLHVAGAAQLAAPEKGAGVEDSPDDADFTADGERPLPPAAHGAGPGDGSLSEPAAPAPVVPAAKADDSQELSSPALPAQGYPVAVGQEQAEPQGLGASEGLGDGIAVAGELEAVSDQVLPAAGAGDAESDALPAVEGIAEGKEAVSFAGSSAVEGQGTEQDTAQLEKRVLEPDETAAGVTTEDAHSFTSSAGVDVSEVRAPEPTAAEGAPLAEASQQATDVVESEPGAVDGLPIARASEDDDHSSGYTAEAAVTYESREPEPATAEGLPIARGDTAAGVTTEDAHSSTSSAGIGVSEVRAPEPTAAEGAPLAEASQQATDVVESEPRAVERLPIARASEDDDDSSGYTAVAAVTYESREPEPATAEGLPIARGLNDDVSDSQIADVPELEPATATVEVDGPIGSQGQTGQVHEPATAEGFPVAGASYPDPEAAEGLQIARVTEDEAGTPTFPPPLGDVSGKDQEALAPPEAATAAGVVPFARVTSEDADSSTHTSVTEDVPSERGLHVAKVTEEADVAAFSPVPGYVSPEPATATGLPVAGVTEETDNPPESTARGLPIARLTEDADIPSSTSVAEYVPIARVTDTPTSSSVIGDGTPESDVGEGRPIGDAKTTAPTDNFPETAPLPLESAASKGVDATDGELDQDEAPKPSKDNGVILDQAPLQATKPLSESGDPGAQDDEHEKQQPETVVTTPSDSKDIDSNSVVKSVLEYAAAAKLEDSAQKHVSDKELQQDTVTIVQVGGSKHRNLAQLLHSEAEVAAEEAPAGSETEPAAKQAKSKVKIFQVAKEFGKTTRSKGARFAKTTLKVLHFRNVNCFSPRKPLPVVSKEDDLDKPRASLAK